MKSLRFSVNKKECIQFSTSQTTADKISDPVKFTTNKAARVPISEVIGLGVAKNTRPWYEKYVVLASLISFGVYFFIMRQENDIDEILKGNPDFIDPRVELIKLKTHLKYCEKNKLPTAKLRAKISELEEKYVRYASFRK